MIHNDEKRMSSNYLDFNRASRLKGCSFSYYFALNRLGSSTEARNEDVRQSSTRDRQLVLRYRAPRVQQTETTDYPRCGVVIYTQSTSFACSTVTVTITMFILCRLYAVVCFAIVAFGATTRNREATQAADSFHYPTQRPDFPVPTLAQIRTILSQLEGPIISKLTERFNIAAPSSFYTNSGAKLLQFLKSQESLAQADGRYSYGKLEYPFTLSPVSPDVKSRSKPFPPGTFHEDGFTGNQNLLKFYLKELVPLFTIQTSPFFHLDNSTVNEDATYNLDATLLQLISHRSSIGKVVAESKFASNVTGFTSLIKSKDSTNIRVLLTNTTQESAVLQQASTAASGFSSAWITAGASEPSSFGSSLQNVTAKLFRELIDVTTDIEVQYILNRLK